MLKILIIDPNKPFQQSLKKLLVDHFSSVNVEVAATTDEGLVKIDAFHPDLIFLEIHLPLESGLELARKIKADHPETIIALLTSYDLPEYQTAAIESGIEHVIPKDDWSGEDILDLIQSIISKMEIKYGNTR